MSQSDSPERCPYCDGTGTITHTPWRHRDWTPQQTTCWDCNGTGTRHFVNLDEWVREVTKEAA